MIITFEIKDKSLEKKLQKIKADKTKNFSAFMRTIIEKHFEKENK